MVRYALLDSSAKYRYLLRRSWNEFFSKQPERTVLFVMLNPSIADDRVDDQTIRKCIGFAKAWGYRTIEVVNLFAIRSPSPAVLKPENGDLVGPENDRHVVEAMERADRVVVAWGYYPLAAERGRFVRETARRLKIDLYCLGMTQDGSPRHPLYLSARSRPTRYLPVRLLASSDVV
jgi:hypothetical protein